MSNSLRRTVSANSAKLDIRQIIRSASVIPAKADTELSVGDFVCATVTSEQSQLFGTVRFVGNTEFSSGVWVGLELREAKGRHDGLCQGKRYFSCKALHGVFVRAINCKKVDDLGENDSPLMPQSSSSQESIVVESSRRLSLTAKEESVRPPLDRFSSSTSTKASDQKKRTSTPNLSLAAARESRFKIGSPAPRRKESPANNPKLLSTSTPFSSSSASVDSMDDNFNLSLIAKQLIESRSFRASILDAINDDMASRSGSSSSASPSLHNHPTEQADSDVTSLAKDTQLLLLEVKAEQDRSKGMMAKLEEALGGMLTSLADVERNVNLVAASASQPADDSPSSPFESSRNGGRFSAVNNGKELLLLEQHKLELEQKDFAIFQLKSTIEIVAHMSKQAHDLVLSERQTFDKTVQELQQKIQMYEIEIAKKYAILK